jgi:hypothetical protein
MAATPQLTRLAGPGGAPRYCQNVAFEPGGVYLAVIVGDDPDDAANATLRLYRRDGDTLTRCPDPARMVGENPPSTLAWTPDGQWLAVTTRNPDRYAVAHAVDYPTRLYQRVGDTLVSVGGVVNTGDDFGDYRVWGVFGSTAGGRIVWDATGTYLLHVVSIGFNGLVRRDGASMTAVSALPGTDGRGSSINGGLDAAWNPADPLLAAIQIEGSYLGAPRLSLWRRTGETMTEVSDPNSLTDSYLTWHPAGAVLLTGAATADSQQPYALAFTEPNSLGYGGYVGDAFNGVYRGYGYDPSGTYLAGGPARTDDGEVLGLTVAAVTVTATGAPTVGVVLRAGDVAGLYTSWARSGTSLYLAAGGGYDSGGAQQLPGGFAVFRLAAPTATTASRLRVADSSGAFRTVGVPGQPLSVVLPDGSTRTWPGSTAPVYVRLADGSWRQVIG